MIGLALRGIGAKLFPWLILAGAATVSVAGILLGARRAGRVAERAEAAIAIAEVNRAQAAAAARRPGDRRELAGRMRAGTF